MCVQILLGAIVIYILFYAFKYLHSNIRLILEYRFVSLCLICTHLIYPLFYASKCFNKPIRVFKVLLIKKYESLIGFHFIYFFAVVSSQRTQSASAAPRQQKKKPFVDPLLQRKDEVSAESKASVCGGTDLFM